MYRQQGARQPGDIISESAGDIVGMRNQCGSRRVDMVAGS
jgi:hypothetical protein